jgi:hypothetical protein
VWGQGHGVVKHGRERGWDLGGVAGTLPVTRGVPEG